MVKKVELKFIEEKDTGIFYFIGVSDDFTMLKQSQVNPPHTLHQGATGYHFYDPGCPYNKEMPTPWH